MEAKDTVMNQQQVWDLKNAEQKRIGSCAGIGTRDIQMNWDDKVILEKQAEITWDIAFKAGYEQVKKEFELAFNPDYLDFKKGVTEGRRSGIQEVVDELEKEFGEDVADGRSWQIRIPYKEWGSKRKKWDI